MKRIYALLALAVGACAVLFPLARPGFFVSDDGGWMIIRLSAFFQSLREGQFPVRFLGRLNYGFGYPVANFLYPGYLYIGSLVHIFGIPFVESVKFIMAASVCIGGLFTFLWLKRYFKTFASVVGALGFISAPYLLFDLYTRGSVGEILALAWAAMGLYAIAAKKSWLLALTVSLLIVSHNTLAVLFLGFYIVYITVLGRWHDFWLMFLLGIGMVMFFWFPALYERKYVVFDSVQVANAAAYFITFKNVMMLGFSGIIAASAAFFIPKPFKKEKIFFLLSFIFTLCMVLPMSGFLWQNGLLTHIVQFPYRFLSLTILIGCWLIAYVLEYQRSLYKTIFIIIFAVISVWVAVVSIQKIQYTDLPEGYYTTNEATTTVADEYMPQWVIDKPTQHAGQKLIFYQGAGTFDDVKITTQSIHAVVHATQDSIVQINTMYYPGWGVSLDDARVLIDYHNNQGLIRVAVPTGTHELVAGFRETFSRFIADDISLGFLIWYGIVLVVKKRHS
jgi:hypothetical protein